MNHDARAVLAVSATTFLLFGVMTALQRFGKWPTIAEHLDPDRQAILAAQFKGHRR